MDGIGVVAAHVHEILDISGRTGQWRSGDRSDIQPQVDGTPCDLFDRLYVMLWIAHDAAVAETLLSDFKLRLHHQKEIGVRRSCSDKRG